MVRTQEKNPAGGAGLGTIIWFGVLGEPERDTRNAQGEADSSQDGGMSGVERHHVMEQEKSEGKHHVASRFPHGSLVLVGQNRVMSPSDYCDDHELDGMFSERRAIYRGDQEPSQAERGPERDEENESEIDRRHAFLPRYRC